MTKKKILFVEDEVELVTLVKMRLRNDNYDVISAYDGQEGLEKVQQENPDLILLDIIMPKMDGLALCRHLKNDPKTKDIPVVIVTALGGNDLPERCRDAGADDVIIKPFESKELLGKIKKLLER